MSVPKEVSRLIEKFDQHLESYRSGKYNEAQLRNEFLNPFFKALGWDMDNDQGLAEAYKDVVHEDAIRIGGAVKAPDYCFRIGGTRKFFLEAKKPSIDIGQETSAAYQLRRYAWSAKLPLSILSDFEEFAVYDCRVKPNKSDSAATARVFLCRFQDYPEKWEWISSIFSKEAILKGSFDKYAEENKAKRGTSAVDDDFLATIERWRSELAKNIALRNSRLSQRELNFAVQRIIDRIIFLRICEDRGSELYGRLQGLTNGPNIYQRLCEVFEDADGKYNSGLFHFKTEKGRHEPPDEITLGLDLDDKLLRDLLRGLYYPESPYEFTVISSDILGQAYEQFLGKVIRLTEGHHAVIEDKPEVKKAGGVYYTPAYIVDYIVKQTVGKLVEGKTPKQVSKLRILDPACGSGSFLINAYQFLLDWHHDWYLAHKPETWAKGRIPVLVQTTAGWKLTITERKRILLDNIYGVDIDPQAVEVTKLSLLLKVLEGESEQTIQPYLRLFSQRALPDLGNNIKCGNSLIGHNYFENKMSPDNSELSQINPFDWGAEFFSIVKEGGFSCLIGNPPYIDIIGIPPAQREYFGRHYSTFLYRSDILGVFFERAISLLRPNGRIGFITSNTYLTSASASKLRVHMLEQLCIEKIINIGGGVFSKANVDTAVFSAVKINAPAKHYIELYSCRSIGHFKSLSEEKEKNTYSVLQSSLHMNSNACFIIVSGVDINNLIGKIKSLKSIHVGQKYEISRGYIAYDAYRGHSPEMISKRIYHSNHKHNNTYKKELLGSDIGRYYLEIKSKNWIQFGDNLAAPRNPRFHSGPRIWIQRIRNPKLKQRLVCYYTDKDESLAASSGLSIAKSLSSDYSSCALCGLLNSRFVNWWYRQNFHEVNIKPVDIALIPLPPNWLVKQPVISDLVKKIQIFYIQIADAGSSPDRELRQRQMLATDKQIDQLVYQLYGLTDEEIQIVEEATAPVNR